MKSIVLIGVLALAGCASQPAAPPLITGMTDSGLCNALGRNDATPTGPVATMQRDEFDRYYARGQALTRTIRARIAAGQFTLKPEQCADQRRLGKIAGDDERFKREHPPVSAWDKVL